MRWLVVLLLGCGSAQYPVTERSAGVEHVKTADGWTLALHHFPAKGKPKATPVVFCHGIMSNKYNWDLTDALSLPARMATQGYDVWILELRGSGQSSTPGYFDDLPDEYTFDDYVLRDVPAAVDYVAARGRSGQVHWVGHSMGGIVMYGYLQRVEQAKIRSLTAVASPPLVFDHVPGIATASWLVELGDVFFDVLPTGTLANIGASQAWPGLRPELHVLWNYDNMAPDTTRQLAAHAVDGISAVVLQQFVAAARTQNLRSADAGYNYTAGMDRVQVPVLFIAGGQDHLAPPAVMAQAFRDVGSADKRIEVFSRANGYAHDYGHLDLVVGRAAPAEVWPRIEAWVRAHD